MSGFSVSTLLTSREVDPVETETIDKPSINTYRMDWKSWGLQKQAGYIHEKPLDFLPTQEVPFGQPQRSSHISPTRGTQFLGMVERKKYICGTGPEAPKTLDREPSTASTWRFNLSHLLIVFLNGQCPKLRLMQVRNPVVITKTSRLATITSTNNSWPTLQDTSRILSCSRKVNLMYQRISGHNRIFQVYPPNTISCLSSLHFGFNQENLWNKVHVDFIKPDLKYLDF